MKKAFYFVFSIIFAVCLSVFSGQAASVTDSGKCGDDLTWTLDTNGTLVIGGQGEMYDYMTSAAPWDKYSNNIKSVIFGDDVESVGMSAFMGCDKLTFIDFANVSRIGDFAFDFCESLTELDLTNVTHVGPFAFSGCSGLVSVHISASLENFEVWKSEAPFSDSAKLKTIIVDAGNENYCTVDGVLFSKDMNTLVQYPAAKEGTSYTVPEDVTYIGGLAFYGCRNLVSVEIGNITGIGQNAFYGCDSLSSVTIGEVTGIGEAAFGNCDNLEIVVIANMDVNIYDAFSHENSKLVLCGYAGSTVQKYAEENGITFRKLGAVSGNVNVGLPSFNITINGVTVDNLYAKYPCIVYNDITYFPMTYKDSRSLGLRTDWTSKTGLIIERTGTPPSAPDFETKDKIFTIKLVDNLPIIESSDPPQNDIAGDNGIATVTEGKITVNGKPVINSAEEYPLLLYRDITYFPLTWRFAVEEFGWEYNFTSEGGLVISCN